MGYQLRLHRQIRAWLGDLRDTEPEQARLVGEAMLALIDAGAALGPPLVVPLGSVLGRPAESQGSPGLLVPEPARNADAGSPRRCRRGYLAQAA